MQKFFAVVGMVVVICVAAGMGRVALDAWWPASHKIGQAVAADTQKISTSEALTRAIIWIRATLPRRINDETKLVAVGLEGGTYWSRLVLDVNAGDISNNAKAAIKQGAIEYACVRLRAAMQGDVISVYRADYVDRARNPVQTVEIKKSDCL